MKMIGRYFLIVGLAIAAAVSPASAQFFMEENTLVGKAAPDFTLGTLNNGVLNMTKFRGNKSAILFFWATWCPHCQSALKNLNANYLEFEKKGIQLILVDLGEEEPQVSRYVMKNKIGVNVFLDKDNSLGDQYSIIGVPTFVFIDQKGIVQAVEHSLPDNYEQILSSNSTNSKTVAKN